MSDELKFIVTNLNKYLETSYNLISFDSLSVDKLLQLLLDVFHFIEVIPGPIDINENDPADTNQIVIESLKKIQYKPETNNNDPSYFRRNLLQGDKKIIYPILTYIFGNIEKVRKLSYLARFLLPIELPAEALANTEIGDLYDEYQKLMESFKEIHREHQLAITEFSEMQELKNNGNTIELETENVKKRIETTLKKLSNIPQHELLLETASALAIERNRQTELQDQLKEQEKLTQKTLQEEDRLQKGLNAIHGAKNEQNPHKLLENLQSETETLEYMVNDKLPQELSSINHEILLMEEIINHPNINQEYLNDLRKQIQNIQNDIRTMIDQQAIKRNNQSENLAPFRRQAALIATNKNIAIQKLDQVSKELHEIEMIVAEKQQLARETIGEDEILSGEELKDYINTLRAKSSLYKEQRSELAAVKTEADDLQQTLNNIKSQNPKLWTDGGEVDNKDDTETNDDMVDSFEGDDKNFKRNVENYSVTELARIVDGLNVAVETVRERIKPIAQQVAPLREKLLDLREQYDIKKQLYNELQATLTSESIAIIEKITDAENRIKKLEVLSDELKVETDRLILLIVKAKQEQDNTSGNGNSLRDTLMAQIKEQELLRDQLFQQKQNIINNEENDEKQFKMWMDVQRLLNTKIQCYEDAKKAGTGGTLTVNKDAETFTLQ